MITKPIIFLDMDGVLNNYPSLIASTTGLYPPGNISAMTVHKDCVQLFKNLVLSTNSDIVLSSSWRSGKMDHPDWANKYGNGTAINALSWAGFDALPYFIGNTPKNEMDFSDRGAEIDYWLEKHPERYKAGITPYVILDDDDDLSPLQLENHFVQTDAKLGLTQKEVDLAIAILLKINI